MRWIIALTLAALLALFAWFWIPRVLPIEVSTPYALLDESTWIVVEVSDTNDLRLLSDSGSVLGNITFLSKWPLPSSITQEQSTLLFGYQFNGQDAYGIISTSPISWTEGSPFTVLQSYGNYSIATTAEYTIKIKEEHVQQTNVRRPKHVRIIMKAQRLLEAYIPNLDLMLLKYFAKEFQDEMWIEFDVADDGTVFQAAGIAATKQEYMGNSDLHLMRYVPGKAGLAFISSYEDMEFAWVHCNYTLSSDPYDNLLLLTESESSEIDDLHPDQLYQNIPITLGGIPSAMQNLGISWESEVYIAHMGDVSIAAGSFEVLVKLIDDLLADDRLIASPYFNQMEGAVSDAGLTLYLRPAALNSANPFIKEGIEWPGTNSLIFQSFSELPGQRFFSLSMLHHRDIVDEAPVVWSAVLDTLVQCGPWAFKNHYTNEMEVLVQDAKHQLYLINNDGKTLWKKRLKAQIVGDIQQIDAYDNGKFQMLFATENELHILDRNGNSVEKFPLSLDKGATSQPSIVRYSKKDDYRIFVNNGATLLNIDIDGNPVKGWKNPSMGGSARLPIYYLSYGGKDYLMSAAENGITSFFDRQGNTRIAPLQLDTQLTSVHFLKGKTLNTCRFIGCDSNGNLHEQSVGSKAKIANILPFGSATAVLGTSLTDHATLCIRGDRFVSFNPKLDVQLDYLLPEAMEATIDWLSDQKDWIGLRAAETNHYYMLDLEGRLLDKMPVTGVGKGIVMDLTGNGGLELILSDGKRELRGYALAD